MYINIATLNKISKTGLSLLSDRYALTDTIEEAKRHTGEEPGHEFRGIFRKSGSYSQSRRRGKQHSSGPVRRRHRLLFNTRDQC